MFRSLPVVTVTITNKIDSEQLSTLKVKDVIPNYHASLKECFSANDKVSVDIPARVFMDTPVIHDKNGWHIRTLLCSFISLLIKRDNLTQIDNKGLSDLQKRRLREDVEAVQNEIDRVADQSAAMLCIIENASKLSASGSIILHGCFPFTFLFSECYRYVEDSPPSMVTSFFNGSVDLNNLVDNFTWSGGQSILLNEVPLSVRFNNEETRNLKAHRHLLSTCSDLVHNIVIDQSVEISSLFERGYNLRNKLDAWSSPIPATIRRRDFIASINDLYEVVYNSTLSSTIAVNDVEFASLEIFSASDENQLLNRSAVTLTEAYAICANLEDFSVDSSSNIISGLLAGKRVKVRGVKPLLKDEYVRLQKLMQLCVLLSIAPKDSFKVNSALASIRCPIELICYRLTGGLYEWGS